MVDYDPYAAYLYEPVIPPEALSAGAAGGLQAGIGPPGLPAQNNDLLNLVTAIPGLLGSLIEDLVKLVDLAHDGHPLNIAKNISKLLISHGGEVVPKFILDAAGAGGYVAGDTHHNIELASKAWAWLSNFSFGLIYRAMLEGGLGVDTSKFDDEAQAAVTTTDTMISFAFVFPFITTAIGTIGTGLFGSRWSHAWHELGTKISEEMGLSWALGLQIDEAYKTAVGRAVEEAINRQKRGNRIDWPQLRVLLKQHVISEEQFVDLLTNHGFPDEQITMLRNLNDVQIPVGDISQLWYRDIISDDKAKELIGELGFNEQQTHWLFHLYMDKAENVASAAYRGTARRLFENHLISTQQYRDILEQSNYPEKLIESDIAAVLLEQETGSVLHSAATIKSEYQHHQIGHEEALQKLRQLNYNVDYANEVIESWTRAPVRWSHGLSQAKVLSYFAAGIVPRTSAETQLQALGINNASIKLLLDNPAIAPMVRPHVRTPGLVLTAFVDGAVQLEDLDAALKSSGVQDADLKFYRSQAIFRKSQRKGSPAAIKYPDTADIEAAQKAGLIDFHTSVLLYEQVGWSPDWSLIKAEIINKGPYVEPGAPVFHDIGEAEQYLISRGFTITPPPDPKIAIAEGMLWALGFSIVPPSLDTGPWSGQKPPGPQV